MFRDGNQIGALTNLCAHQNGPLGEGCIINGLVTCPWHGYEYRLADGCAPPPFTEKLATYRVRLRDGMIEVDPTRCRRGLPQHPNCLRIPPPTRLLSASAVRPAGMKILLLARAGANTRSPGRSQPRR